MFLGTLDQAFFGAGSSLQIGTDGALIAALDDVHVSAYFLGISSVAPRRADCIDIETWCNAALRAVHRRAEEPGALGLRIRVPDGPLRLPPKTCWRGTITPPSKHSTPGASAARPLKTGSQV